MRRRIDRHDLDDVTTKPHHYLDEIDGDLHLYDTPPALYDDALWAELIEARKRLREVEARVTAALVSEPLDAVEIELGRRLARMTVADGKLDSEEWSRIEGQLIEHAQT